MGWGRWPYCQSLGQGLVREEMKICILNITILTRFFQLLDVLITLLNIRTRLRKLKYLKMISSKNDALAKNFALQTPTVSGFILSQTPPQSE